MKLKSKLSSSPDLIFTLTIGAVAYLTSFIEGFALIRWVFGFLFVFFASGYSITRLLPKKASVLEKIIVASSTSLLLTYPASVMTVLIEGQTAEAIFGRHLSNSILSLLLLSLTLSILVSKRKLSSFNISSFPKLLFFPLIIYIALTFTNLNRADVFGDEYDLGYQAYNLVDGIVAGRKAYLISMSQHPPLSLTIKHYTMNILEPSGLDNLQDWQFRVSEALMGVLTIIAAYLLSKELFLKKTAIVTAFLFSVNNYLVWMGRIFHREMYLTFFMTVAALFYVKAKKTKNNQYILLSGIAIGTSLLVKETAIILLSIPLIDAIISKKSQKLSLKIFFIALLIFLPVLLFNVAAFISTGFADVFFSNLFGLPHPLTTPRETTPILNLVSMFSYLFDIYSPLIYLVFCFSLIIQIIQKKTDKILFLWIALTLLFFSLTAIRAYYFLFITIPLTIITANIISGLKPKVKYSVLLLLIIYSAYYSINTNINSSYTQFGIIPKSDGSMVVKHPINIHRSLTARSWSEEVGYKQLQKMLNIQIGNNDCLIVSQKMEPLAVRRYLLRMDKIKEYYLGSNYPTRYPRCPTNSQLLTGDIFLISNKSNEAGKLDKIIEDHLGNPRFYLFILEKGNYS